jgi:hypothetical protein
MLLGTAAAITADLKSACRPGYVKVARRAAESVLRLRAPNSDVGGFVPIGPSGIPYGGRSIAHREIALVTFRPRNQAILFFGATLCELLTRLGESEFFTAHLLSIRGRPEIKPLLGDDPLWRGNCKNNQARGQAHKTIFI